MTAAEQLAPDSRLQELVRCERHHCTLQKRACLERRAKRVVYRSRHSRGERVGAAIQHENPAFPMCQDCPVGEALERDLGAVETTRLRTPAAVLRGSTLTYRPAEPSRPCVVTIAPELDQRLDRAMELLAASAAAPRCATCETELVDGAGTPCPSPSCPTNATPDPEPEPTTVTGATDMTPKPTAVAADPPRRLCSKCKTNPLRRDNESGVCVQCARPWEKRRETGVLSLIPGEFDPAKLSDDQLVACLDEARQRVTKRREDADRLEKAIGGAP